MNLVVAASGMVGTEICRLIAASGKPVKALVRASSAAAKVENLKRLGATLVQGDLRDRGSLKAACSGVNGSSAQHRPCPSPRRLAENTPQSTDQDGWQSEGRCRYRAQLHSSGLRT